MTDTSFAAAGYAVLIENDPIQKFTTTKIVRTSILWFKNLHPSPHKDVHLCKGISCKLFRIQRVWHIFWGAPEPVIILTDNKAVTQFFQTKNVLPALWNACDYAIQINFVIAHIPGAQNKAADYLSRLETDPNDKLVMKTRGDVQTLPIEINVQSAGVSQEEQIFYTNDETEEQFWARERQFDEILPQKKQQ